jgi:TrmH family RNA methyltransferase
MKKYNLGQYVEKYRNARKGDGDVVLLEGIHAFKHALRFGAQFKEILYVKDHQLSDFEENVLLDSEREYILEKGVEVDSEFFDELLPYTVRSKIVALAVKPEYKKKDIDINKAIVFLENPANPENIGMSIRVAAAYGAGALVVSGRISPLSGSVIRAAAGLVFALPVFMIDNFSQLHSFGDRILIVADPEGESIKKVNVPSNSVIIFGTEREGVSVELKDIADKMLKIDMVENVSSLNLATSVSAFLFGANFE